MKIFRRKISICALIAIRNEAPYLEVLLSSFAAQKIDVVIFDNGSSDETPEILRKYAGSPIIDTIELDFSGSFSLSDILRAKRKSAAGLPHDWFIHHDADEILEHRNPGKNLRNAIQEADDRGFNVLNFEEFVFLPLPDQDYTNSEYPLQMLRYYYFKPSENRLNRAWKRTICASTEKSGGHRFQGKGIRLCKTNHILRHYIVLSQEHAYEKYFGRSFSREDLSRGWHTNRLELSQRDLRLPNQHDSIFVLPHSTSKDFNRSQPVDKHYWHWEISAENIDVCTH